MSKRDKLSHLREYPIHIFPARIPAPIYLTRAPTRVYPIASAATAGGSSLSTYDSPAAPTHREKEIVLYT